MFLSVPMVIVGAILIFLAWRQKSPDTVDVPH